MAVQGPYTIFTLPDGAYAQVDQQSQAAEDISELSDCEEQDTIQYEFFHPWYCVAYAANMHYERCHFIADRTSMAASLWLSPLLLVLAVMPAI